MNAVKIVLHLKSGGRFTAILDESMKYEIELAKVIKSNDRWFAADNFYKTSDGYSFTECNAPTELNLR